MGYKYKPNKGMKKRFRVSATGKVKHNHSFTSHLRSSRSSKRIRHLRRASVLFDGHARNMREFMGIKGVRPNAIAAKRRLAAVAAAAAKEGGAKGATASKPAKSAKTAKAAK
jgi:large subunit ribosomal protein L35